MTDSSGEFVVNAYKKKILAEGPSVVLINRVGDTTEWKKALELYNVVPDVIYIRVDGYSLGAPEELDYLAKRMDKWIGKIERPARKKVKEAVLDRRFEDKNSLLYQTLKYGGK